MPTVPTDNLYKFMAIVGLLMIAAGLLVPAYVELEYIKVKTRVNAANDDYNFRFNIIKSEAEWNKTLHEIISRVREAEIKAMRDQPAKEKQLALAEDTKTAKEAEALVAEGKRINEQMVALQHEIVPQFEQAALADYLNDLRRVLRWVSALFVVAGSILAGFGFGLWFVRLQRPLDKQMASGKRAG